MIMDSPTRLVIVFATIFAFAQVSAEARPKGLSGDLTIFRCDSAQVRSVPSDKQDLIVSISKEIAGGRSELLAKRSDFSLSDVNKIFGKSKQFSISGTWPGVLTLIGFVNGVEFARVELAPASREAYAVESAWMPAYSEAFPKRAVATTRSASAGDRIGSCVAMYLTPARPM